MCITEPAPLTKTRPKVNPCIRILFATCDVQFSASPGSTLRIPRILLPHLRDPAESPVPAFSGSDS